MKCVTCKLYDVKDGTCRFNPPVRFPRRFDDSATPESRVRNEELIWGWPLVGPDDWCGQWTDAGRKD